MARNRPPLLSLLALACALRAGAQENLDFEFVEDGELVSWRVRGHFRHEGTVDEMLFHGGDRSLRLSFLRQDPEHPRSFGVATQSIPAADFIGGLVSIDGFIRTDRVEDGYAGLWVRIDGADGPRYVENMWDRPVDGTRDWQRYEIRAPVTVDAHRILFGAIFTGEGSAWFDDFTVTRIDPSASPPAPDVVAYLEEALAIMAENSVRRDSVDWSTLRAQTLRLAAGATTTVEAYPALRVAIEELGDAHSNLFTPEAAAILRGDDATSGVLGSWRSPSAMTFDDTIGYVSVPGFIGTGPERTMRFADEIQAVIADVDSDAICGWVVDLREDTGGNVFPMLAGLGPILGDGDFGGGIRADGTIVRRWHRAGRAGTGAAELSVSRQPYSLIRPNPPIAVLIGPRTASSGEATALAFIGAPTVRSFGQPTAGATTGNAPFPLSDGAVLNLAVTTMMDRVDRTYGGPIVPDVEIAEPDPAAPLSEQATIRAANEWVHAQRACLTAQ
jgi:C-terminal processing protease CtpA/Prc